MRRDEADVFTPEPLLATPWPAPFSVERVIEVLEPLVLEPRRARLLQVIGERLQSVTLVMDAPHDPHNGAAVLRSADAFGVQSVHIVPRSESFLVSANVAKGTERWVDVTTHPTAESAIGALRQQSYRLVATHPEGRLVPDDLATIPRVALVMGNEHDGISEALARAADDSVRIPMRGFVESLNVSVSAAVLLAFATRGRSGDLGQTAQRLLYARGLYRTVKRAEEVLDASAPQAGAAGAK